jgi:hypothetical protein
LTELFHESGGLDCAGGVGNVGGRHLMVFGDEDSLDKLHHFQCDQQGDWNEVGEDDEPVTELGPEIDEIAGERVIDIW